MAFYLQSVAEPDKFKECNFNNIISLITGNNLSFENDAINSKDNYTKLINLGTEIRKSKNEKDQKALKKQLPAFGLAHFSDKIHRDYFVSTEYIIFDIDNLSTQQLNTCRERLKEFAFFYFTSVRGKGLKFIIRLKSTITNADDYKATRNYYKPFFSDYLGIDVDTGYNAWQSYLSVDKEAFHNPESIEYDIITEKEKDTIDSIRDVDVVTDELTDVANHLRGIYTDENTYFHLAMAFASAGERGKIPFVSLEEADIKKAEFNHSHRNYKQKWEWAIKNCSNISIGTLFYIAKKLANYERKPSYVIQGVSKNFPFPIAVEEGWCTYNEQRAFSFNQVTCKYRIDSINEGTKYVFEIKGFSNGTVEMLKTDLNNISNFKKKLANADTKEFYPIYCYRGNQQSETLVYSKLSTYFLDKTYEAQNMAILRQGIGCVSTKIEWDEYGYWIWNFGSHVLFGKKTKNGYEAKISKFTETVPIEKGENGYFAQIQNHANTEFYDYKITENKNIKEDIRKFKYFYGNDSVIALGWMVAQLFYKFYSSSDFPVLFLTGDTTSGKTTMAKLMLASYGAWDNSSCSTLLTQETTLNSMDRLRDKTHCIPIAIDESSRNKDIYKIILSAYNAQGKSRATKDSTNKTVTTHVYCGGIFMQPTPPPVEELINRGLHIRLTECKVESKKVLHNQFVKDRKNLSCLMISLLTKINPDVMIAKVRESHDHLSNISGDVSIDSRELNSYSYAYAGYKILVDLGLIDSVPDDWWIEHARETLNIKSKNANAPMQILSILCSLTNPSYKGKFSSIVYKNVLRGEQITQSKGLDGIKIKPHTVYVDLYLAIKRTDMTLCDVALDMYRRNHKDTPLVNPQQVYDMLKNSEHLIKYATADFKESVSGTWSVYDGEIDESHCYDGEKPTIICAKCGYQNTLGDRYCSNDEGEYRCNHQLPSKKTKSGIMRFFFPIALLGDDSIAEVKETVELSDTPF